MRRYSFRADSAGTRGRDQEGSVGAVEMVHPAPLLPPSPQTRPIAHSLIDSLTHPSSVSLIMSHDSF